MYQFDSFDSITVIAADGVSDFGCTLANRSFEQKQWCERSLCNWPADTGTGFGRGCFLFFILYLWATY